MHVVSGYVQAHLGLCTMTAPAVSFSGVSFAWPDPDATASVPLLDDFHLRAEPGCVTAIVGPSGSGKSTLLKLAAGLIAPRNGAIEAGSDLLHWSGVLSHIKMALPMGRAIRLAGLLHLRAKEGLNSAGLFQ